MNCKMVIVVRKDLKMPRGKIGAQCGHAVESAVLDYTNSQTREFAAWRNGEESARAKIVVCVNSEEELKQVLKNADDMGFDWCTFPVIDAGRTEFNGVPTLTCAAIGPLKVGCFVGLTDHLPLYN